MSMSGFCTPFNSESLFLKYSINNGISSVLDESDVNSMALHLIYDKDLL